MLNTTRFTALAVGLTVGVCGPSGCETSHLIGELDGGVPQDGGGGSGRNGGAAGGPAPFVVPAEFAAGVRPASVAVGDFDGDGKPDLAVADSGNPGLGISGGLRVLLNQGHGRLAAPIDHPAGTLPACVVTEDLNGDGRLDLVVANLNSANVSVFLNAGGGAFLGAATYDAGVRPSSVAIGDLNRDGRPDLVVANSISGTRRNANVLLNAGGGTFAPAVAYDVGEKPTAIAVGDLDGDGWDDLAVVNYLSRDADGFDRQIGTVSVRLNRGDGTFSAPLVQDVGGWPTSISLAELNGDGSPDAVVANALTGDVSVLINRGRAAVPGGSPFAPGTRYGGSPANSAVAVGDVNGDARADLAVVNGVSVNILLNDGKGGFGSPSSYVAGPNSLGVALGDLDGDGAMDVAVANAGGDVLHLPGNVGVLTNDGAGALRAPFHYETCGGRGVALGDIDGDGRSDIAVADGLFIMGDATGRPQPASPPTIASGCPDRPTAVAMGDLNGDGRIDRVVLRDQQVEVFLTKVEGLSSTYWVGGDPAAIVLGDLNGDGRDELIVRGRGDASNGGDLRVLLNRGDGTFAAPVSYLQGSSPRSAVAADVNRDGRSDLVVTLGDGDDIGVLISDEAGALGTPSMYPAGGYPRSIAAGDLDGDGHLDVILSVGDSLDATGGRATLLRNDGAGGLLAPVDVMTGGDPFALALGDLDGDGDVDLIVADGGDGGVVGVVVLANDGHGTFGAPDRFFFRGSFEGAPLSVSAGDIDGDGHTDIVASGYLGVTLILGRSK